MKPSFGAPATLPVLLCVLAPAALAQTPDTLPEVTVRARAASSSPVLTLPSVRAATAEAANAPGGVSVVDLDARRDERLSNLTDALGTTAGVYIQPRFGQDESRLSIRGSGVQRTFHLRGIRLLQDGVPLVQADGAGDFQAADVPAARYIEVLRGANAMSRGSTSLGGAVNLVSPSGHDFADGPRLDLSAGSNGYRRALLAAGGVRGDADFALTTSWQAEDGFRRQSATENWRVSGNLGWRLSPVAETRFFLSWVDTRSELPGNLTLAQLRADPTQANPVNLAGNQQRDFTQARVANRTVLRLPGDLQLELAAYHVRKELVHPIFQLFRVDTDDAGIVARLQGRGTLFGIPHRFTFGFEPQTTRQDDRRFVNLAGQPGAATGVFEQRATTVALYAETRLEVSERNTLVLGAQAARTTRRVNDLFRAGGVDRGLDLDYERVSPRVGFVHRPTDGVSVFGNASGLFEPPSFGELTGGPNVVPLRAQHGRSLELGARGAHVRGSWEVVLYEARLRNELLGLNDAAGQTLGTVNAARTLRRGLEAAAEGRPVARVAVRAAWLLHDLRFDGDPVYGDNRLPGLSPSLLRAQVLVDVGAGVRVGPTVEWSMRRYPVDMANTLYAPAHAIWGLRAAGPLGSKSSWWIEGRNLSDRRHVAATGVIADARGQDSAQFLPGVGRSVFAGLRLGL